MPELLDLYTADFPNDSSRYRFRDGVIEPLVDTSVTTVSGNPISFETLNAQHAKNTIIDIEPIQDLHGYDTVWTGGTRKNKLNTSTVTKSNITFTQDSNGYVTASPDTGDGRTWGYSNSQYKLTLPAGTYLLVIETLRTTTVQSRGCTIYNSSDQTIGGVSFEHLFQDVGIYSSEFTLSSETSIGVFIKQYSAIARYMIIKSTDSTTYEHYSNICPITGRTSIDINGCSKNLVNNANNIIGYYNDDGDYSSQSATRTSELIKVKPNTCYTAALYDTSNNSYVGGLVFTKWDKNQKIIDQVTSSDNVITSATTEYLRVRSYIRDSDLVNTDHYAFQLEENSVKTAYATYNSSNDITVQFGTTVYGAKYYPETGQLIADRIIINLGDTSTITWAYRNDIEIFQTQLSVSYSQDTSKVNISSCYPYNGIKPNGSSAVTSTPSFSLYSGSGNYFWICDKNYNESTKNDFINSLSGQTVLLYLANPITIQLTPIQISLLEGYNNISTTGNVITLSYENGKFATLQPATETTDGLMSAIDKIKIDNVEADLSSKVSKTGDTMTGQLYIKGQAVSKPLKTRGIIGADSNTNDDGALYLQYNNSIDDAVYFGSSGGGAITNNGTKYNGTANKATNDVDGNPIKTSYAVRRILTNENLNNVTAPGFYNAAYDNTCTNKPSGVTTGFGLEVAIIAGQDYYNQVMYIPVTGKTYRRYCSGQNTWTSWTEVTDYTPTEKTKLSGISTEANKVQSSTTNGNIKIDGTETKVYDDTEIKQELDSETIEITGSNPVIFDAPAVQKSKDTVIHIKPFQDMNGYGNPYPGGGGKNLLNISIVRRRNTSKRLEVIQEQKWTAGDIYVFSTNISGLQFALSVYDDNGTALEDSGWLNPGTSYTIKNTGKLGPAGYGIRYSDDRDITDAEIETIRVSRSQLEKASTSTLWAPYENTCPLIPRNEINIEHAGENLFNPYEYEKLYLLDMYSYRYGHLYQPGSYTVINNHPANPLYYRLINADKSSIEAGVVIAANTSSTVTVPNNKLLFVYTFNYEDYIEQWKQTYVGLTSYTDGFKEYNIYKKLKVLLGDDYYGGTLNLETGEFSVEYGYYTLTGNETMGKGTADQGVYIQNDNVAKLMDYTGEIRSDKLPTYGDNSHLNPVDFGCSGYADVRDLYPGQNWIYIKNINCQDEDSATTKANYKTWLQSANISIIYPLANPYTIQLSAEQLDYVKGINSVFTDNFDDTIDTTYREGIYATSEELKDVTDALNRTASIREGNPVYIESNVDQNAKSSNFTIEPVQDLHGWSKPWLGNTGKNKAPLELGRLKSINTDGTWTGNNYVIRDITYSVICDSDDNVMWINASGTNSSSTSSAYFYIIKNEQFLGAGSYKLNGCPAGGSNDTYKIAFQQVDSTGAYITSIDDTGSGTSNPLTVSAGDYNVLVLIIRPAKTVGNIQYKPMIYLSSETDTSYEPYSNKCSISGRTELPVYNYNNMIDMSEFNVSYDMDVFSISAQYGTEVTSTNRYTIIGYINLYKGETINVKLPNTTTYKWAVFKYQSNGTYIEWTNWITNNTIPTLAATVGKIRIVFGYQDDRNVTEADKKLFMSFLSITRKPVLIGYFGFNSGTRAYPGNWLTTALLPCKPNTEYSLSSRKFLTNRYGVNFFDENEVFISTSEPGTSYTSTPAGYLSQTFTTPSNAAYFNYTWHTPLNTPDQIDDLFIGAVRNTLTVKLGTTVYGAELDLENGRLVLDHKALTLPTDTSKWAKSSHSSIKTGRAGYWCNETVFTDCVYSGGDDNSNGVVMSYNCYPTGSTSCLDVISSQAFAIGIGKVGNITNLWINVSGVLYPDVASWCAYLTSNPIQAYYPLATPIVYEISKENLKLFKGANTITIDYGQMAIEYSDGSVAYLEDIQDFIKSHDAFSAICASASTTVNKVVRLVDDRSWELRPGVIVGVKYENSNTASNCTINVNGSGNIPIWYNDSVYSGNSNIVCGRANRTIFYQYNGSYWCWISDGVIHNDAVTQVPYSGDNDYRILLSCGANDNNQTDTVKKNSALIFNPSKKRLNVDGYIDADGYCRVDISGQTLDLNSLSLSAGTINETYYICKTNGGAANITHRPRTDTYAFILDVKQIRWVSSNDFITLQTYRDTYNTNIVYERTCNTSTWSDWVPRLFTDQSVTQSNTTTSDWRKVVLGAQHDSSAGTAVTTQYDQVYVNNNLEYQPSTNTLKTEILTVNGNGSGTSGGLSLYMGNINDFSIIFRNTTNKGVHGAVQGDWATYFTMNNTANRGWIFKNNGTGNVASINNNGHAVFNGSVTVGGNAANTSGAKMVYDSTYKTINFEFL